MKAEPELESALEEIVTRQASALGEKPRQTLLVIVICYSEIFPNHLEFTKRESTR